MPKKIVAFSDQENIKKQKAKDFQGNTIESLNTLASSQYVSHLLINSRDNRTVYGDMDSVPLHQTATEEMNWFSGTLSDLNKQNLTDDQKAAHLLCRIQSRIKYGGYKYGSDQSTEGVKDYWSTPQEVLDDKGKGIDCEDFAFMAQAYGQAGQKELGLGGEFIVIGGNINGSGHAICVYKAPNGETYVIDGTEHSIYDMKVPIAGDVEHHIASNPYKLETLDEYCKRRNFKISNQNFEYIETGNGGGKAIFNDKVYMTIPPKDSQEYAQLPDSVKNNFQPGERVELVSAEYHKDTGTWEWVGTAKKDPVTGKITYIQGIRRADSDETGIKLTEAERNKMLETKQSQGDRKTIQDEGQTIETKHRDDEQDSFLAKFVLHRPPTYLSEKRNWLLGTSILEMSTAIFTALSVIGNSFKFAKETKTLHHSKYLRKADIITPKIETRHRQIKRGLATTNILLDSARFGLAVSVMAGVALSPLIAVTFCGLTALKALTGIYETANLQMKKLRRFNKRNTIEKQNLISNANVSPKTKQVLNARIRYKHRASKVMGGAKEGKFMNFLRVLGNIGLIIGSIWTAVLITTAYLTGVGIAISALLIPLAILLVSALTVAFARIYQAVRKGYFLRQQKREMFGGTYQDLRKFKIEHAQSKVSHFITKYNFVGRSIDWIDDYCKKLNAQKLVTKKQKFIRAMKKGFLYTVGAPFYFLAWLFQTKDKRENDVFNDIKEEYKTAKTNEEKNSYIELLNKFYQIPKSEVCLRLLSPEEFEKIKEKVAIFMNQKDYLENLKTTDFDHLPDEAKQIKLYQDKALEKEKEFLRAHKTSLDKLIQSSDSILEKVILAENPLVFYDPIKKQFISLTQYKENLDKQKLIFGQ